MDLIRLWKSVENAEGSGNRGTGRASKSTGDVLKKAGDVFAHLVLPEGPVVAALGAPVVEGVANALAGEDFRKAVGGAAILPRAGAGGDVNIARSKLAENPGIVKIGEVVDGIVEIKIVVVHAVHEIADVVDAGHGEATLDDVGMLEEGVCGVIGAEGGAHGGDGDALALAVVPDEGNDFLAKVGIEDGLNIAAMERMCALVIKAEAVNGIDAKDFEFAAIDEVGERANHALAFEFVLVTGAGGKTDERLAPMAVDDDAKVKPQAGRVPAVNFAFHEECLARDAGRMKYASGGERRAIELRGEMQWESNSAAGVYLNEHGVPSEERPWQHQRRQIGRRRNAFLRS